MLLKLEVIQPKKEPVSAYLDISLNLSPTVLFFSAQLIVDIINVNTSDGMLMLTLSSVLKYLRNHLVERPHIITIMWPTSMSLD